MKKQTILLFGILVLLVSFMSLMGARCAVAQDSENFEVTFIFRKPNGAPLSNTGIDASHIGYNPSGTPTAVMVGVTDSEGKITISGESITSTGGYTLHLTGGHTIYLWDLGEQYHGSTYVAYDFSGGTVTVMLNENPTFPWLLIIAGILGLGVVLIIVWKKRIFKRIFERK